MLWRGLAQLTLHKFVAVVALVDKLASCDDVGCAVLAVEDEVEGVNRGHVSLGLVRGV